MIARRLLLAGVIGAGTARAETPRRIVCVGGAVTECAFALGAGAQVVAVHSTSRFPAPARTLPQIGYMRALAPEGLIALRADALLLSEEAGPPQAIAVLRAAGAKLVTIPEQPGGAGVLRKITAVAAALGVDGAGLSATVGADWAMLDAPVASLRPLSAIFVLSASRGAPLVAGENTQAGAMLAACGARNAMVGFQGYRPLSAEAAAQIAPDVVVMMEHALAEAGGIDAVLRIPALAVTPVARSRRVVAIEGSYALGFGPRAAHARADLTRLLHPGAALPTLPARAWT